MRKILNRIINRNKKQQWLNDLHEMRKEIELEKQESDEIVKITEKLTGFDRHMHRFALQHQKVIDFQLKTTESEIRSIANNEFNLNDYEELIKHRRKVWEIARQTYKVELDEKIFNKKGNETE